MKNILIIDDESTILSVLYEYLTGLGYFVKVAHNGDEGLRLFNDGYDFDLVITDINMPILDGNEVARHIKNSDQPEIPLIAITGSYNNIVHEGLFDFILPKPFKLSLLKDKIKSYEGMV